MARRFLVFCGFVFLFFAVVPVKAEDAAPVFAVDDEFVGPFASWGDVKHDFGAVGDGKADDTGALQRALDELRKTDRKFHALYLPAGTYRITQTLRLLRERHEESQNIMILGEDPATTIIRWDGPVNGVMFDYGAWYARMGRFTFDGVGKAGTALAHGKNFATYNEFSDMVFRDVGFGIEAGAKDGGGIAETVVMRCQFLRCAKAGISLQNFNTLDWFIWYSTFEDCGDGVTNIHGAGNFYAYHSLFLRSKHADTSIGNTGYFSLRDNTSVGSRAFFVASSMSACSMLTIQRNTILDTIDTPIQLANFGPLLLLDNVIKTRAEVAVQIRYLTGLVSMGNTFTVQHPIRGQRSPRTVDDKIVEYDSVRVTQPVMPVTPPHRRRRITEIPVGGNPEAIQKAIDTASKQPGERPVVHLPAGSYSLDRTLVVPAGCDVQLVGDGIATRLRWDGKGSGPLLRLDGPSRATLRDLAINGNKAVSGIEVANCDQLGARILMDQVNLHGEGDCGLLVDRLQRADVSLLNLNHADQKMGIKIVGAGKNVGSSSGRTVIFCGASSNNELSYEVRDGGRLLVRDTWYETPRFPRFMRCVGAGEFTLHGGQVAPSSRREGPMIEVDDFRGKLSFLNTIFATKDAQIVIRGEGRDTKALFISLGNRPDFLVNESAKARVALLDSFRYWHGGSALPVSDQGKVDDAFLREMFAQTRREQFQLLSPVPSGSTDLRLYRVNVENTRDGIRLGP